MIKIAAMSDMHGRLEGLDPRGCEICVVAGDFSRHMGFGRWAMKEQRDWIHDEFFAWTGGFPGTTFVVVAGNHDLCLDPAMTSRHVGENWKIEWPGNVKYLCDSGAEVHSLKFYGTPWVPIINCRWAFEGGRGELKKRFSAIPENVDVLVTHAPPRLPGYLGDVSLEFGENSERFGSSELAEAVFEKRPRRVFCGHIHSGSHEPFVFNGCTVVQNVSRVDESYEVAYEPAVVVAG